jgi:hypothetical protein
MAADEPRRSKRSMLSFAHVAPSTRNESISIDGADVHVWAFMLSESNPVVEAWRQFLSDDEKLRATVSFAAAIARAGSSRTGCCAICSDAIAASIRARSPSSMALRESLRLREPTRAAWQQRSTCALARSARCSRYRANREIGVDLEQVRDDFDPLPIAREFFFGTELAAIQAAAPGAAPRRVLPSLDCEGSRPESARRRTLARRSTAFA